MIQGKSKRRCYFFICGILSLINKLILKNKHLIFFFSTTNLYDNSEALFQYLIKNGYNEQNRIVVAVNHPEIYNKFQFKNVKFISVFHSIPYIFRAKYIFYHNEMLAIMPTKKQISIDFWHATTFKKINKMIDPDYRYDFFTYITATSELYRPIFAESFGCSEDRVIINGHPRNDYLFMKESEFPKLNIDPTAYKKVLMWMPTYRFSFNEVQRDTDWSFLTESGLPIFKTNAEVDRLNDYLKAENALLLIKLHPAQNTERFHYESRSNIVFLTNPQLDDLDIHFYSLLKDTDALITDYSSVFFDYLLLHKPMAFTVDDLESYQKNRGFVFSDPQAYMPGEKIREPQDFYTFLSHCFSGVDPYEEQRKIINDKVNYYKDGRNCERIVRFVGLQK